MYTLTLVHCNPAADHFTWYYVTTLHRVFDIISERGIRRISTKAHQVLSNLHKFSIKCTAKTFNSAICVVNDYKHSLSLTIDYLNYDFIMTKSLLLEK